MAKKPHLQRKPAPGAPDLRWIYALSHPLRLAILDELEVRKASPNELKDLLSMPLSHIAYHTRILRDSGVIKLVGIRQRRGATEHFYRSNPKSALGHPSWRKIPRAVRGNVTAMAVEHFVKRLADAIAARLVDESDNTILSSIPITVDERGWKEANKVLLAALAKIEKISDTSLARLGSGGSDEAVPLVVGVAAFQAAVAPAGGAADA